MTTAETKAIPSRPLGKIENFFYGLTKSGLYNSFTSCLILDKPAQNDGDRTRIMMALKAICFEYPMLLSNIFNSGSEVKVIDSFNFAEIVEFKQDNDADNHNVTDYLQELNDVRFEYDVQKTLFKLSIVNDKYFYFIFDHAIFDGRSAVKVASLFNEKFQSSRSLSQEDLDQEFVKATSSLHISKTIPIEEAVPLVGEVKETKAEGRDDAGVGPEWMSKSGYVNNKHFFKLISLSTEEASNLLRLCKSKQASVSVYLQQCFFLAQTKTWPTSFLNDSQNFSSTIAYGIDCRPFVEDAKLQKTLEIGSNATGHQPVLPISSRLNWDQIKKDSDAIRAGIEDRSILYRYGQNVVAPALAMGANLDWESIHRAYSILNGQNKRANLVFANLGLVKNVHSSDTIFFSASAANLAFLFSIAVVGDVANGMKLVLTMVENDEFTEAEFDTLIESYKHILLNPELYI